MEYNNKKKEYLWEKNRPSRSKHRKCVFWGAKQLQDVPCLPDDNVDRSRIQLPQ